MTAHSAPGWLDARQAAGVRLGLDRVREALERLGRPERAASFVLVGGTNGKGSVAAALASVLTAAGHRTGLFTSPHLVRIGERIRVDGEPIPQDAFQDSAEAVREVVERFDLTYFEALTLLAFHYFREIEVEIGVLEVGLGGRLDATNVIHPVLSVVTNVELDHVEALGPTIEHIAVEKAGIFREGVPALTAASGEALAVLAREAAARGAQFRPLSSCGQVGEMKVSPSGTTLAVQSRYWGEIELRTRLSGRHQATNIWAAAEAAALLPDRYRPERKALIEGVETLRWPGRLDRRVHHGVHFLLDVAHNPAGIETLCRSVDELDVPRPRTALVSICADKPWKEMIERLALSVDALVLSIGPSIPEHRRWDLREAASAVPYGMASREIPDLDDALARVATLAPHGTVIVAGSAFLVGDVLARIEDAGVSGGLPR